MATGTLDRRSSPVVFSIASMLVRSFRTGLGLFLQKSTKSCPKIRLPRVLPYRCRSLSFLIPPSLIFLFLSCRCLSLGFELFFGQLTGMRMNVSIDVSPCGFTYVLPPLALRILQGFCSSIAVYPCLYDFLNSNRNIGQKSSPVVLSIASTLLT